MKHLHLLAFVFMISLTVFAGDKKEHADTPVIKVVDKYINFYYHPQSSGFGD